MDLREKIQTLKSYCAANGHEKPSYKLLDKLEVDGGHRKVYVVRVTVPGLVDIRGDGMSRRLAEQRAADRALRAIDDEILRNIKVKYGDDRPTTSRATTSKTTTTTTTDDNSANTSSKQVNGGTHTANGVIETDIDSDIQDKSADHMMASDDNHINNGKQQKQYISDSNNDNNSDLIVSSSNNNNRGNDNQKSYDNLVNNNSNTSPSNGPVVDQSTTNSANEPMMTSADDYENRRNGIIDSNSPRSSSSSISSSSSSSSSSSTVNSNHNIDGGYDTSLTQNGISSRVILALPPPPLPSSPPPETKPRFTKLTIKTSIQLLMDYCMANQAPFPYYDTSYKSGQFRNNCRIELTSADGEKREFCGSGTGMTSKEAKIKAADDVADQLRQLKLLAD